MAEPQTVRKQHRPRKPAALPPFKETSRHLAELYSNGFMIDLLAAIENGASKLTIEIDIPSNAPAQGTSIAHTVRIYAAMPRYTSYHVIETDNATYNILRTVTTREEALQAIEELRGNVSRGFSLQVMGVRANGLSDGVHLLEWGVKRTG